MVEWEDRLIIPLDMNSIDFRYFQLDQRDSSGCAACIEVAPADRFWEEIVGAPSGPTVVGLIGFSVLTCEAGLLKMCPLDYTDIRLSSKELDSFSFNETVELAKANGWTPPAELWS